MATLYESEDWLIEDSNIEGRIRIQRKGGNSLTVDAADLPTLAVALMESLETRTPEEIASEITQTVLDGFSDAFARASGARGLPAGQPIPEGWEAFPGRPTTILAKREDLFVGEPAMIEAGEPLTSIIGRPSWRMAFSFDPKRRLTPDELRAMEEAVIDAATAFLKALSEEPRR